jgi:acetylornithine deacetylase/succinyl-diaminopimelate desuccinylase-like protein
VRQTVYVALYLMLARPLAGQSPAQSAIDWTAIAREATTVLADYLRIDTSNPPGNELEGARFLQRILQREGIEAQILDENELGTGRANLYARLRGNGSKRALALVHHIDVVPASPQFWTVPPFSGSIQDGFLWGRGALDNKGEGIMYLMAMIALKRSGFPLSRDIVYIANADEELGSTGAKVFVDRHADLLRDVEYLITEATENGVRGDSVLYFAVGVAEKRTLWQRLTVRGIPSHGSKPTKANPVPKLVRAVHRLGTYETPIHLTPGVERFFRDISTLYQEPQRSWLRNIRTSIRSPRAREWILSNVDWNAYLRNTITPTVLQGSNKTNVIPPEATAEVDVRILPDQNPDTVIALLKRIVADTAIHFQTILEPKTPLQSPIDSDVVRAVERAARERRPGVLVTTPLQTGATDRPTYQRLGVQTYAIDPFLVDARELQTATHGNNERVSLENIAFGVRYVYDIIRYLQ